MRFASHESGSSWLFARKLVAPEPLEERNAPSTLLPWGEILASPFAHQGDWFADLKLASDSDFTENAAQSAFVWNPVVDTRSAGEPLFAIDWTDEVVTTVQQPVTSPQVTTELPATTAAYEAAAIDGAFAEEGDTEEVPPPVIQPVITDPESEFNQPNFGLLVSGQ